MAKVFVTVCFKRIASFTVLAVDCMISDVSAPVMVKVFDLDTSDACLR
jgi:hypothetical protein